MQTPLKELTTSDEYERLPEAVRQFYTKQEFSWMSDEQKASLVADNTEPEWEE